MIEKIEPTYSKDMVNANFCSDVLRECEKFRKNLENHTDILILAGDHMYDEMAKEDLTGGHDQIFDIPVRRCQAIEADSVLLLDLNTFKAYKYEGYNL